jgi:outer membrane protein assembly factor BamB
LLLAAADKRLPPPAADLPVAAPWYSAATQLPAKRVIPVRADKMIFIATERGVVAAKENGELAWQFEVPQSDKVMAGAKLGFHRPAVVCDSEGKPQLLIVRQIIGGTRFGCLRALRAADGKLLWSTESNTAIGSSSMVSSPALAGRAVIVIGIDDTVRPAPLGVWAFDVMTGRLLWQTTLGTFPSLTEGQEPGSFREVDALWRNSGVSIDGPDVFVDPGTGFTACLDRFNGKVRWLRSYTSQPSPGDELLATWVRASHNEPGTHELYRKQLDALRGLLGKTQLVLPPDNRDKKRDWRSASPEVIALSNYFSQPPRWASTPAPAGDVLEVAASDMAGVVGLDRRTGAQLWEIPDDLRAATLIGASGNTAVFAAGTLTALDTHAAKVRWTWESPSKEPIQGPPSLAGTVVRAVAGKTTYVLSVESGQPDPLAGAGAGIAPLMAYEPTRNALINIDAYESLSAMSRAPETPKNPEPKKKK